MKASTDLLRAIGINLARNIVEQDDLKPEAKLWRCVILNAFEDAFVTHSDRKNSLKKLAAHNWIISMCDDFKNVCMCAELDPILVKEAYTRALREKNIRFTKRQLMWLRYDRMYNRMKNLPDKEKQRFLRKRVKQMRENVFLTSTEYVSTVFLSVLT
tara:strand:+ start:15550 stop:16020 length:471 start_codon:yes stop_codon:yes gene_type:complete